MSKRRGRGRCAPPELDVSLDDDALVERYFGESEREGRGGHKTAQLCKQVERAVSLALAAEGLGEGLLGAVVAAVEPAPDAARLCLTVVLAPGRTEGDLAAAWAELSRTTPRFRAEVARAISRKRVPELAWSVRLGGLHE